MKRILPYLSPRNLEFASPLPILGCKSLDNCMERNYFPPQAKNQCEKSLFIQKVVRIFYLHVYEITP